MFSLFFNDTATTEIYTLSLHDALPISSSTGSPDPAGWRRSWAPPIAPPLDRKSTRLNSSHLGISYAVFCLKKKKKIVSDFGSFYNQLVAQSRCYRLTQFSDTNVTRATT